MPHEPPELSAPQYNQAPPDSGSTKNVEIDRGAIYRPLHVEREVKIYPIQEHELKAIGLFNAGFTICCSIAAGASTLAASIVWDMAIDQNAASSPLGNAALSFCGLLIFAAFIAAFWLRNERQSELEKIVGEVKKQVD